MITRAKISAVRANSFVVVEQFIVFFLVIRNSSNKRRIGGAALIRGRRFLTFLSQVWGLLEGGAYSSKYGSPSHSKWKVTVNIPEVKLVRMMWIFGRKLKSVALIFEQT